MTLLRRVLPMIGWIAGLLVLGALMLANGRGTLAGPDVGAPSTWGAWASTRPAPDAAMAVLRLLVLALDAYLLAATAIAIGLRVLRAERAISIADLLTLPPVLRVVQAGLGVGLIGASVAAAASGAGSASVPPTHADIALVSADDEPPMIRELPEHVATTTTTTLPPAEPMPVLVAEMPAPQTSTWLVQPGDHFWSIAERTLATAWGRAPTDAEVVPYWHELVERNRDELADRDNADLIFPGQTFVLPAVPAVP